MSDELTDTEEITEVAVKPNGERPKGYEKFDSREDDPYKKIQESMSSPESNSGVRMLVVPGNDITDMTMRADFPNQSYLIAAASLVTDCRRHHDKVGEAEIMFVVSGMCGIKGKRAEMLVDAIIGERVGKMRQQGGGFMSKFKEIGGFNKTNEQQA